MKLDVESLRAFRLAEIRLLNQPLPIEEKDRQQHQRDQRKAGRFGQQ